MPINTLVQEKILDFEQMGIPQVFQRDLSLGRIFPPAIGNLVTVIVGARRSGKTFRLYQQMQQIVDMGYPQSSLLYFNFEDERLKPYSPQLLTDILDTFYAMHPESRQQGIFLFFDEIQEVPEWGTFLRRVVDTTKATIYVTGSSSRMLSLDLATEFRGRSIPREMFPLSFSEFVRYNETLADSQSQVWGETRQGVTQKSQWKEKVSQTTAGQKTTGQRESRGFSSYETAKLRNLLGMYLQRGGFMVPLQLDAPDAMLLLQEYANRTASMDIVERYGLRNQKAVSLFLARCLASSARELSISKTYNDFRGQQVPISRQTLSDLLGYFEESYLVSTLDNFGREISANTRAAKKVYAVDPGMFTAFSTAASVDLGQRLETAVFNQLRRSSQSAGLVRKGAISRLLFTADENRGKSKKHEIDFVVGDSLNSLMKGFISNSADGGSSGNSADLQGSAKRLVQVSVSLDSESTRERELSALDAAMRKFGLNEGEIVTFDQEEEVAVSSGTVHVVPAWKWLLG